MSSEVRSPPFCVHTEPVQNSLARLPALFRHRHISRQAGCTLHLQLPVLLLYFHWTFPNQKNRQNYYLTNFLRLLAYCRLLRFRRPECFHRLNSHPL